MREVMIPIAPGLWLSIKGEFPLTESEWEQALNVLKTMKPALTKATADAEVPLDTHAVLVIHAGSCSNPEPEQQPPAPTPLPSQ